MSEQITASAPKEVNLAQCAHLSIPEGEVKRIIDGQGNIIWERKCINQVPLSTEEDSASIYNSGKGYVDDNRLNVTGDTPNGGDTTTALAKSFGCTSTGYIPITAGQTLKLRGALWNSKVANFARFYTYNKNKKVLKGETVWPGGSSDIRSYPSGSYLNQIPLSTKTPNSEEVYNEVGFKKDYNWDTDHGNEEYLEREVLGGYTTGWFPAPSGSTIYLKNMSLNRDKGEMFKRFYYYNPTTKAYDVHVFRLNLTSAEAAKEDSDWGLGWSNGNLTRLKVPSQGISHVSFSAHDIGIDSIISVNQIIDKEIEYENQISLSTNNEGKPFGYITGYRLSDNGIDSVKDSNYSVTGFIPVINGKNDKYYTYNLGKDKNYSNGYGGIFVYDKDYNFLGKELINESFSQKGAIFTDDGYLVSFSLREFSLQPTQSTPAYIRICSRTIDDTSVVTALEPMDRNGPGYIERIAKSTDASGNIYNGKGYEETSYLNSSGTAIEGLSGTTNSWTHPAFTTGFIPVKFGDVIRLNNCYIDPDGTQDKYGRTPAEMHVAFYTSLNDNAPKAVSWEKLNSLQEAEPFGRVKTDDYGNITQFTILEPSAGFIRLTLAPMHAISYSKVTINEIIFAGENTTDFYIQNYGDVGDNSIGPINTAYCRISVYGRGRNLIAAVGEDITDLPSRSTYTNKVNTSLEKDGTIYNSGLGYMNGVRISTAGMLEEDQSCIHTGFIPIKKGQTVRVTGMDFKNSKSCVYSLDKNFKILEAIKLTKEENNEIWSCTPMALSGTDPAYVQVVGTMYSDITPAIADWLVVTVDQPIDD